MTASPPLDFFEEAEETQPGLLLRHRVDVVLVTHDGARWLPRTLAALRGSSVRPDAVHVLDTGSIDGTEELLMNAGATISTVLHAPREQAYGVSLAQLIDALPVVHPRSVTTHPLRRAADAGGALDDPRGSEAPERRSIDPDVTPEDPDVAWIWVIHDDSAPATEALAALLRDAEQNPDAGILGCKSVGWNDSSRLQDVGITLTGSAHRFPRVERGERDQGQYQLSEEVLAVGSAGMLIRRDVWRTLNGMRPMISFYRDDVDLCWRAWEHGYHVRVVPQAEIAHREAATHGVRAQDVLPGTAHRIGREVSLATAFIHARPFVRPFTLVRLVLASLARAFVYFVGKDPRDSGDELAALFAFLRSPLILMREIEARGIVPVRAPRRLRPKVREQLWHGVDLLSGLIVEKVDDLLEVWVGSDVFDVIDVIDDADDATEAVAEEPAIVTRSRRQDFLSHVWKRPGTLLFAGLLMVSLLGTRNLWGTGDLQGGGLLPAVGTAGDLWSAYLADWHRVGMGSAAPAAPWMPLLAAFSLLFGGNVAWAVTALLVLGVPLAGLSAHLAARGVIPQAEPRAFLAATYALLPGLLIGVSNGRLGVIVFAIALPALMRLAWSCDESWPRAATMALGLGFTAAWVPIAWPFFVIIGAVSAVVWRRDRVRRLRLLFIAVASWAVVFPASLEWLLHPGSMLRGAGTEVPNAGGRTFLDLLLTQPGGAASPWLFATVGLPLAAAAALIQRRRTRRVVIGWVAVAVMFTTYVAVTLVAAWTKLGDPATGLPMQRWGGPFTLLLGMLWLVIIASVADGMAESLSRVSLGWRHIIALALTVGVIVTPVLSAGSWLLRNGESTVTRSEFTHVPAFVEAIASQSQALRVLALHRDASGTVRYSILDGKDFSIGDSYVARDVANAEISRIVGSMLSGRDRTEAQLLAKLGIMYVVSNDGDPEVLSALDGSVGLRRVSGGTRGAQATWQVQALNERAAMLWFEDASPIVDPLEYRVDRTLQLRMHVDAVQGRRVITIAEPEGPWSATLNGRELAVAPHYIESWRRAWVLPAGAEGQLVVHYMHGQRAGALVLQLIAGILVLFIALPTYRRLEDPDREVLLT